MERRELLPLSFYEKSPFTGSIESLRYRIEKITEDDEKKLQVAIWHGKFAYDHTPEEDKTYRVFDFSEEGMQTVTSWINEKVRD